MKTTQVAQEFICLIVPGAPEGPPAQRYALVEAGLGKRPEADCARDG